MIWKQAVTLETLNQISQNTLVSHLGIEFIEIGEDYLKARMPVDERTRQPYGLLHGGASASLAETIASVAGLLCLEDVERYSTVGVELNISHMRAATKGYVMAKATPLKLGRRMQFWAIETVDEQGNLISVSRLTQAVVERKA